MHMNLKKLALINLTMMILISFLFFPYLGLTVAQALQGRGRGGQISGISEFRASLVYKTSSKKYIVRLHLKKQKSKLKPKPKSQ